MAGAGMMANGDYGLATYPWDLTAKTNAAPANQKTSLIEVGPSPLSAQLLQLLSLSTVPAFALGMIDAAAASLDCIHVSSQVSSRHLWMGTDEGSREVSSSCEAFPASYNLTCA